MSKRFQSTKWFYPVYAFLVLWGGAALFAAGYWAAPVHVVRTPARLQISPKATYATVKANFTGKPYVQNGQLSELPGFACDAWTNGAKNHGWVVIVCKR